VAELLTDPRTRQAEAEPEQAYAFGNEGLAQDIGNLRRFDLETARCNSSVAHTVPIRKKLPTRWLLHVPPDAKRYTLLRARISLGQTRENPVLARLSGHAHSLASRERASVLENGVALRLGGH